MKAIILAAGRGTRLDKYTKDLPKGMLTYNGKPLIYWQLECLRSCGIKDIIIVKGYKEEKINFPDVKYYINNEYDNTNMISSLMCASTEFNDDIIVCYSDILYQRSLIKKIMNSPGDYSVLCDTNWKMYWQKRYNTISYDIEGFSVNNENTIISIGNSNPVLEEIDARYIGILKFSCKGINYIKYFINSEKKKYENNFWRNYPRSINKAYMTDLLNILISDGIVVKAVFVQNGWLEFDTNDDYENSCKWFDNNQLTQLFDINK